MDDCGACLLRRALRSTHEVSSAKINHSTARSGERHDSRLPALASVGPVLENDPSQILAGTDPELRELDGEVSAALVSELREQPLTIRERQPLLRSLQYSLGSIPNVGVLDVQPPGPGGNIAGRSR